MTENTKKKLVLISSIIFVLIIFLISLIELNYSNFKKTNFIKNDIILEMKPSYTLKKLSKTLDINYFFLKKYIKKHNSNFELKPWKYEIKKNSQIKQIIIFLETPIETEVNIIILEGWNIYDIDYKLALEWFINKWDYIKYVTNSKKIKKLSKYFPFIKKLETLEGFLYPDTYKVNTYNFKVNEFVIKQLEAFEEKVYEEILKDLTKKQIIYLINLASIVEKEVNNPKQKFIVSWILKKRFKENRFIWADITVCYPYKLTSEECKLVVSKYLKEKNDYNTRTKIWLPKTPISNPSYETIYATINHTDTDYWFYLHDKNWNIHYATTNKDHERNKHRFLSRGF